MSKEQIVDVIAVIGAISLILLFITMLILVWNDSQILRKCLMTEAITFAFCWIVCRSQKED